MRGVVHVECVPAPGLFAIDVGVHADQPVDLDAHTRFLVRLAHRALRRHLTSLNEATRNVPVALVWRAFSPHEKHATIALDEHARCRLRVIPRDPLAVRADAADARADLLAPEFRSAAHAVGRAQRPASA